MGAGRRTRSRSLADPQMEANGYLVPVIDADGNARTAGGQPGAVRRDPADGRRGARSSPSTPTTSCASSARTTSEIIQLKIDGACT